MNIDVKMTEMFDEIAEENKGHAFSSRELTREIGSRLKDPSSILRVAYEVDTPVFLPAIRDSEFGLVYRLHSKKHPENELLRVDAFKEVSEIVDSEEKEVPVLGKLGKLFHSQTM